MVDKEARDEMQAAVDNFYKDYLSKIEAWKKEIEALGRLPAEQEVDLKQGVLE